jgi:hypothetical protein
VEGEIVTELESATGISSDQLKRIFGLKKEGENWVAKVRFRYVLTDMLVGSDPDLAAQILLESLHDSVVKLRIRTMRALRDNGWEGPRDHIEAILGEGE